MLLSSSSVYLLTLVALFLFAVFLCLISMCFVIVVDTAWPGDYSNTADTRLRAAMDRAALPTAPRAARGPDVDMSKLPKEPPYTAFLGNLPYDVEKEDILQFFHGINVSKILLP